MRSFFFILLGISFVLLVLSPQTVDAQTQTRGSNYVDTNYGNGTHTWQSAPEWILDNGVYKSYKLFEDANVIRVETGQGSFIFNKSLCGISFYNAGVINGQPTISLDNYTVLGTTVGNQNFVKVNSINNAACQASVVQSGNDIEVWGTKHVDNVGTFKIKYIKKDGSVLKTQLEPTNENPVWNNHKLGITQILGVPNIVTLGDTQYDLRNFNNTVLDRAWLVAHKSELLKLSNTISFDFSLGFQYVDKITIFYNGVASYLIIDYWNNTPQILPGQTLIIDPTFVGVATLELWLRDNGANDNCDGNSTSNAGGTTMSVGVANDVTIDCDRAGLEFNTTSIPDTATIQDVDFSFDVVSVASPRNCDYMPFASQPSTLTTAQQFTDIGDGTAYLANDAVCITTGDNKSVDLGTTADSDLQSRLVANWFAVGIKANSEAGAGTTTGRVDILKSTGGSPTPPPTLTVLYSGYFIDAVTDLQITGNRGTAVDLRWSQPNIFGFTLLGYQINYTTPWASPLTILNNNTGTNTTTITVSPLSDSTQYSFRVSAQTSQGTNATGNIVNVTTTIGNIGIGSLNVNGTNPNLIPILFNRQDINATALFLNFTYSNSFILSCDLHYKFAQNNQTYTSVSSTTVGSTKHSAFQFNNVTNEIIDVFCWNQADGAMNGTNINSTNSGRYLITQSNFLLLQQIANFRSGVYGTSGQFGVLDFMSMVVIILSMVGLNRVNESVGGIFVVGIVGVCWAFGIIDLTNFIIAGIALTILLIIGTTKKD